MSQRPVPGGPLLALGLPDGAIALGLTGHRPADPDACDAVVLEDRDGSGREALIESLDRFLDGCAVDRRGLSAVVFEAGPGPFSRVRTACAVAQGIGFGLSIPVGAFDSLLLEAACAQAGGAPSRTARILVLNLARPGEFHAAAYTARDERWEILSAPRELALADVPAWRADTPAVEGAGADVLAGDGWARIGAAAPANASGRPRPDPVDRVTTLARLAAGLAAWGPASGSGPVYLREKVALDVHEQAALRAARPR